MAVSRLSGLQGLPATALVIYTKLPLLCSSNCESPGLDDRILTKDECSHTLEVFALLASSQPWPWSLNLALFASEPILSALRASLRDLLDRANIPLRGRPSICLCVLPTDLSC